MIAFSVWIAIHCRDIDRGR